MGRLFGTDGVRGIANRELTPELAFYLGRAASAVLLASGEDRRPNVLVGRDTRASGQMLEAALVAGLTSAGVDVTIAGVMPTPGVAHLTRELADAGAMISASHNPVADNGIKFFSGDGFKLSDSTEDDIERIIAKEQECGGNTAARPIGEDVGRVHLLEDALERYVQFLTDRVDMNLAGMRIVLDCANGAAYEAAPKVFRKLGADVIALNIQPTGGNINVECGSTHPSVVSRAVLAHNAHVGLSYDGDADRVIACDEKGCIVDGDHILAVCAIDMIRRKKLPKNTIAATVYSNLGLKKTLEEHGGHLLVTPNGDRYVLEAMVKEKLALGGEQSGHIIFLDDTTTGDGILSSLRLLEVMYRSGEPLSKLAQGMTVFPQVLRNVRVRDKSRAANNEKIMQAVSEAERKVGPNGRVFIRPSGTEPLIRVMVEGEDLSLVESTAQSVVTVIEAELGRGE